MPAEAFGAYPRKVGFYGSGVTDDRALRIRLIEELRRRVPFDWHVWTLNDPETEVAISPLATMPDHLMGQLPGIVLRRYLTRLNRWDSLDGAVDSLYRASGGRPEVSLLHLELLGPAGVGDVASAVFRDRFGCWGFLDVWRSASAPAFSDADLAALAAAVPPITEELRRCQATSFDVPASAATTERTGPAVLFLSPALEVLGQTPDTDNYLRALLPTADDRRPVPAGAYNVAAALIAGEAGCFDHPPMARVRLVAGTWLTFRAARIGADRPPAERDVAVTIELSSPAERRTLFTRSHGLSARETDVVDLVAEGADTRTIAARLFVSEHTVQDHLKSIFAKTGTRNRRTLFARVAGG